MKVDGRGHFYRKKLPVLGYWKLWILIGKVYQIFLFSIIVLKYRGFFNLRYIWWVICWPTILSDSLIFRGFRYLQMFSNRKVLYFFYIIRYNYTSFPDICLYAIPWCRTVPIRIKDAMISEICDIVVYIAVTKLNKNPTIVGLHVVKNEI